MVVGDEVRVRQMLVNLIGNAVKFTERGSVTVNVERIAAHDRKVLLRFSVADTGIGISDENKVALFKAFSQADTSTIRRFGGTGLGLSIVKLLAERMGGGVGLESQLGLGSQFWFDIPLGISSDIVDSGGGEGALRRLRVFIADDNQGVVNVLLSLTRRFGWDVECFDSGNSLISATVERTAHASPPDCILVDWRMPEMDGTEAIKELSKLVGPDAFPATVLISAESADTVAHEQAVSGFDGFLVKPISASNLFNTVNRAVARRRGDLDHVLTHSKYSDADTLWLPGVRVLVVDDSEMNLDVCRRQLEHQGATVTTCLSGTEAISTLECAPGDFDIVLMDVQMPEFSGLDATREIRAKTNLGALPIVALTAGAMAEDRDRAFQAGMNGFLSKPFEPAHLVRVIRRHVQNYSSLVVPTAARTRSDTLEAHPFPEIPGIDTEEVRRRCGGDRNMFLRLLASFVRQYRDMSATLAVALPGMSRSDLKQFAHKIRGQSANLGAHELSSLSAQLEACANNEKVATSGLIGLFQMSLEKVLQDSESALSELLPNVNPSHQPIDHFQLGQLLTQLEEQLGENSLNALSTDEEIAAMLRGSEHENDYRPVSLAINEVCFSESLSALETFKNSVKDKAGVGDENPAVR